MSLPFLLGNTTSIHTHDTYGKPGQPVNEGSQGGNTVCQVVFTCKNKKRRIVGLLSGGFNVEGNSSWESPFQGALGTAVSVGDSIAQLVSGGSIRQPWFGRKYWRGTSALKFTFVVQFASFRNAEDEVYKPALGLLSLVYPRYADGVADGGLALYRIPGPSMFSGASGSDLSGITNSDRRRRVENAMNSGDAVNISFGSLLEFNLCYITNVSLEFGNSFTPEGFPHTIKASVTFETMDVSYVGTEGEFMQHGFADMSGGLGKLLAHVLNGLFILGEKASAGLNKAGIRVGDMLGLPSSNES